MPIKVRAWWSCTTISSWRRVVRCHRRTAGRTGCSVPGIAPGSGVETLREFGAINSFAVLLADLLKRYRANCYEQGQVEAVIKRQEEPKQADAALALLRPILDDYQALLDSAGHIDFDDMIGKAIEYVREGRFRSPWRYILVDEFQDISEGACPLDQVSAGLCAGVLVILRGVTIGRLFTASPAVI